jgi:prephenate dehydrogenase
MTENENRAKRDLASLKIAIVGLGLMGGSLAMALRGAVKGLVGYDKDAESRIAAVRRGVVETAVDRIEDGVTQADLVVLAVPVESIISLVETIPQMRPDGCMLLDLGSTKRLVGRAMESLPGRFAAIGGHPMCGREQSGIMAATSDLYRNQTFILCRNSRTTTVIELTTLSLIARIGAKPLFMSAATHDELVATSSHLPYVVSAALMELASSRAAEDERLWQVSASGLSDTTRLAGSSPEMMLEIMLTNRGAILTQIEAYGERMAALYEALRSEDRATLRAMLETARQEREAYLAAKDDQLSDSPLPDYDLGES